MVKAIIEEAKKGKLTNALLFIFADNSTVEGAIAKGNSPSEFSFELILELNQCKFQCGFGLHAIHASGKRMIVQGTDGASRGDLARAGQLAKPIRLLHLSILQLWKGSMELKDSFYHSYRMMLSF